MPIESDDNSSNRQRKVSVIVKQINHEIIEGELLHFNQHVDYKVMSFVNELE